MKPKHFYLSGIMFALFLFATGLLLDTPANIAQGLLTIYSSQATLTTDYVALAGVGAALFNSASIILLTIALKAIFQEPINASSFVDLGLMSGFALFGKNLFNVWPIILGAFLFSKLQHKPFRHHLSVGLLATALAPVVSLAWLDSGWGSPPLAIGLGMLIGFLAVPLSNYTYIIQNGMNLYNMGFCCGMLATVIVPLMRVSDHTPAMQNYWATGYNVPFALLLGIMFLALLVAAVVVDGKKAFHNYRRLIRTTGRPPSDYLGEFGIGAVCVNMAVNGAVGMAIILITGGDLNGNTVGCIFTIMGFSAVGKHIANILPVQSGVLLGSILFTFSINDPSVQVAVLFCTALAPISGFFGWQYGILAGVVHSALVLQTSSLVEGVNLYNNGFSGGLIAIVLYPILSALVTHRKAKVHNRNYIDQFMHTLPDPNDEDPPDPVG